MDCLGTLQDLRHAALVQLGLLATVFLYATALSIRNRKDGRGSRSALPVMIAIGWFGWRAVQTFTWSHGLIKAAECHQACLTDEDCLECSSLAPR